MLRRPGVAAWAVLVAVAAASLVVAWYWRGLVEAENRERFDGLVADTSQAIEDELRRYEDALEATASHLQALGAPEPGAFLEFAHGLRIDRRYPGLYGMALIEPNGERFTITAIERPGRNQAALGQDLAADRVARRALVAARDSGQPVLSERRAIVPGGVQGVSLYVAVYERPAVAGTVTQRRDLHLAWVSARLIGDPFLEGILGQPDDAEVAVWLYVGDAADDDALAGSLAADLSQGNGFRSSEQRRLFGQVLTLEFESLPGFVSARDDWEPPLVLAVGLLVGVLLFALVRSQERGKARALALVEERTRELAASRARFREAFDHAPVGIALVDLDGTQLEVNDAFCKLLGAAPHELVGRKLDELTHPDDRGVEQANIQRLLSGEVDAYEAEKRYLRPDGSFVWTLITRATVEDPDGRPSHFITQVLDITDRKQAEQELRETTRRLEEVVAAQEQVARAAGEESAVLEAAVDLAQRLTGADGATVELPVGAGELELVVTSGLLGPWTGARQSIAGSLAGRCFANSSPQRADDDETDPNINRRLTREIGIRSMAMVPLQFGGDTLGVLAVVGAAPAAFDREDLAMLDLVAGTIAAGLAHARQLATTRELLAEVERSNVELQQFASVASHDLQEPLRMITGFLQLLERHLDEDLDDKGRQFIGFALDGAARMRTLISDLLAYARVGSRGRELESVELQAAFDEALANLGVTVEDTGAVVTSDPLPTVQGDASQLVQLFQNLLGNAIKFSRDDAPRVQVSATADDGAWVIGVQDNGIGIDPEYHEQVFGIFQRLHGREEYSGTGVGLAICSKVVERHGGRIWVESTPGSGTTFFFTLPPAQTQSTSGSDEPAHQGAVGRGQPG